jgi:hypothetical protein
MHSAEFSITHSLKLSWTGGSSAIGRDSFSQLHPLLVSGQRNWEAVMKEKQTESNGTRDTKLRELTMAEAALVVAGEGALDFSKGMEASVTATVGLPSAR